MITYVREIVPENVERVGDIEVPDEVDVATVPPILLTADWQGAPVKGIQVGGSVVWFLPYEFDQLATFFGDQT